MAETVHDLRLSDALMLAFLTGGAYWIAFRYEAAFLGTYGFPPHVVEVSLETTLVVLLLLSGVLWLLFPVANLLSMLWPTHPALQEKLARLLLLLGLPFWHLIQYGYRIEDWLYYFMVLALVGVFEVLWPMFVYRDKQSLREKFIADEIAEAAPRERTLTGRLLQALGPSGYMLVLLVILGGWLARTAGDAHAVRQERYLVPTSDRTLAVVRLYRDRALYVRVDRQTHTHSVVLSLRRLPAGTTSIQSRN